MKISFWVKITIIFTLIILLQGAVISAISANYGIDMVISNKKKDTRELVNLLDIGINSNIRYTQGKIEEAINKIDFHTYLDLNIKERIQYNEKIDIDIKKLSYIKDVNLVYEGKTYYKKNKIIPIEVEKLRDARTVLGVKWLGMRDSIFMVGVLAHKLDEKPSYAYTVFEIDMNEYKGLLFDRFNNTDNQTTLIVDKNYKVVATNKALDREWQRLVLEKHRTYGNSFYFELNKEKFYVNAQYNGITGWRTISAISIDLIKQEAKSLSQNIRIARVSVGLVFFVIVVIIAYMMMKPLHELSSNMEEVIRYEKFEKLIKTKRSDEIGVLIRSYNKLLLKINKLINSVYKKKLALQEAEIRALQMQINPHFLYNTLDSINWLAIEEDANKTSEMVIALGDLLHYSTGGNNLVLLEEEIDYVLSYLQLQKNRLGDRLSFEIDVSSEAASSIIPKLSLQPIVENAILHGIEPKSEGGYLCIQGKVQEGLLKISIKDNGVGIEKQMIDSILEETELLDDRPHIGVSNANKRIQLYFGEQWGLHFSSKVGEGTKVDIVLPRKEEME